MIRSSSNRLVGVLSLNNTQAVIYSVEGAVLSDDERSFFHQAKPLGFILFGRNVETPEQLKALTHDLRDCVGWHCPVLIDQEGGRVQRLKPPIWRGYPCMQLFGAKAENDEKDALQNLRFIIMQLAEELVDGGVDVDCAPVLDVLTEATHDVIGDRAFSENPEIVSRLGLSVCRTLLSMGVTPVIKHIPGHGRGTLDSHKDLPRVDASLDDLRAQDFVPFKDVAASDIGTEIWAMTAHIVYEAIDADLPCSASSKVIHDIIRGDIGFDGVLLSDDLDMQALDDLGDVGRRAEMVLEAGCDVALYCSGRFSDMQKIANSVPNLSESAQRRLQNSLKSLKLAA